MCCFKRQGQGARVRSKGVRGQGSGKTKIFLVYILFFFLAPCPLPLAPVVHAQDNHPFVTDNDQFNYASFLLKQGHFSAAAREFGRVIEQFPSSPHIPASQYMIAESYFKAGRYNDAIKEFTQFASNFPDNKLVSDAVSKKDVLQIKLKESVGFPQPISNVTQGLSLESIKPNGLSYRIKAAQVLLFKGKTYEEVEQEIAKLKDSGINTIIVRVFHNKGDRFHPFVNSSEKIQTKIAADAVNKSVKPVPEGFNRGTEFVPLEVVPAPERIYQGKEDGQRLREFLNKWRESWEGKRLDDYMSCYSKTFKARGMDWDAWERYKASLNKINSQRKVLIRDIKILKQDDNHYVASFIQRYIGEDTNDTGIKKLYLEYAENDIKIIGEEWTTMPEEKHPASIAEKSNPRLKPSGTGIEAGVYFETKHAPVVEDILGKITEFSHKQGLKIFAWMTTRYADYGIEDKIDLRCKSYDFAKNRIVPCKGLDLFNDEVVSHLEKIYKDLARYDIDGILFQDDLYLKHNEGFGQYASALYLMDTGKPLEPAALYNGIYKGNDSYGVKYYTPEFWEWAGWKNKRLLNVAKRLMQTVKDVNPKTRFAINLMYESASNPVYALAWLSQNLDNAVAAGFDYYAIMAYHLQMQDELKKESPYIERLIESMTREAVERVGSPSKVIMKVQTIDWNTSRPLADKEVLELLKRINNVNNVSLAVVPYRIDFPFNAMTDFNKPQK
ncbi:MAG: family 10 glycosylhydrolase [Deltaproteobacteria bacterium]|nr:family 10 glycosylhydrolase [Deltaproteobacteria bacterium]